MSGQHNPTHPTPSIIEGLAQDIPVLEVMCQMLPRFACLLVVPNAPYLTRNHFSSSHSGLGRGGTAELGRLRQASPANLSPEAHDSGREEMACAQNVEVLGYE